MNKTKMILAGTGGAIGLVVLVLAFLVWQAFSAKTVAIEGDDEEGTDGLETVEARAQSMSRKTVYPCAASLSAIAANQKAVEAGAEVVLCSDGGYPGISDPGYRLIRTCARKGVPYDVIPGASAVNVALLMSGLSTSSFTFRGFPPRGPGALRNWFAEDADKEHTFVCYESPFRIAATLEAALDALGDREAAVCIELTKLHERVSRGYLSDLVKEFADKKVKGEVALVIAGNNPKFARTRTNPEEPQGE